MEYEEEPDYDRLRDYFIEVLEKQNEVFDYIYVWSTEEEKKMRRKEYLEEKQHIKKRKNTSKTNSVSHLATKLDSNSNEKEKEKTKRKERRQTTHNMKHLDEEEKNNINRNSPQKKINYKFPTKENSFEGIKGIQDNNQEILNSPINETGRKTNRTRTHNVKRKSSRIEDELKKENEEVCCTEACIII